MQARTWLCALLVVVVAAAGGAVAQSDNPPSQCTFWDSWAGAAAVTTGPATDQTDSFNVSCADPTALPLKSVAVTGDDGYARLTTALVWEAVDGGASGTLNVQTYENSAPQTNLTLTVVDGNDDLLVVALVVRAVYRGIPATQASVVPDGNAVRQYTAGDTVNFTFSVWNANHSQVTSSGVTLAPVRLVEVGSDYVFESDGVAWSGGKLGPAVANASAGSDGYPVTRAFAWTTPADAAETVSYAYCLQVGDEFHMPYCRTHAPAGASPFPQTTTGLADPGCVCVNFVVRSTRSGDDGRGGRGGLTSGQIAAAVVIPLVAVVAVVGFVVWRRRAAAATSTTGHVLMPDDAAANTKL